MGRRRCKQSSHKDVDLKQELVELDYDPVLAAVNKVLGIELLREMILNYAIRHDNGKLSGTNLANMRLVSTDWNSTLSKLLGKSREPLLTLALAKRNRTPLNKFVKVIDKRKDQFCPTLGLKISKQFIRLENCKSLTNYFLVCSPGLVELELEIMLKVDCRWLVDMFGTSKVTLPVLQKMKLRLTYHRRSTDAEPDAVSRRNSRKVPTLLRSLLQGNENLREFSLRFTDVWRIRVPVGFSRLSLSPFITKLELNCELTNDELAILAGSKLPNVHTLELTLMPHSRTLGILSWLLANFRKTLRQLQFNSVITDNYHNNHGNWIIFPRMDKLETFRSYCTIWQLTSNVHSISRVLPKLKQLSLFPATTETIGHFTSGPPTINVEILALQLVSGEDISKPVPLPMPTEIMQAVHHTFPRITSLTLEIPVTGWSSGMKFLYKEMRQLTHLKLIAAGFWSYFFTGVWASILLCIPRNFFKFINLPETVEFIGGLDFANDDFTSVRMLTELETLELGYDGFTYNSYAGGQMRISDFAFEHSLFHMPKLKNLLVFKGFQISDASSEAWTNQGKKITYVT